MRGFQMNWLPRPSGQRVPILQRLMQGLNLRGRRDDSTSFPTIYGGHIHPENRCKLLLCHTHPSPGVGDSLRQRGWTGFRVFSEEFDDPGNDSWAWRSAPTFPVLNRDSIDPKQPSQLMLHQVQLKAAAPNMVSQRLDCLWNRLFALPKVRIWAA